ncbi:unnamed protein product, partial [marine sediment metagenome]
DWLATSIGQGVEDIGAGIGQGLADLGAGIDTYFTDLGTTLSEGWDWLATSIGTGISDLGVGIATGLEDMGAGIDTFFSDLWTGISDGFEAAAINVQNTVGGLFDSLTGLAGDILAGAGDALGGALEIIWTSITGAAGFIAEGLTGIIGTVSEVISPIMTPLFTTILGEMEIGLSPDSPPAEIQAASEGVSQALITAFRSQIPIDTHSPPSVEDLWGSVALTVAQMTGVYVLTSVISGAMDLVHPLKSLGIKAAAMDILHSFSISKAIEPMISSEIWAGITVPLRMRMKQK